jgi:O-antigen/teichoic acid export membrane protein
MQKKFLSNLVLLMLVNLLVKPFWVLGIDRTMQNTTGLDTYGQYAILLGFSMLFSVLLDFGIQNFNSSSLARNQGLIVSQFPALLFLKLMLAILFAALTMVAGWIYGFTSGELWLLSLLIINQTLGSFFLFIRSNISGLQLFRADALLSATDKLFMIATCSVLIWGNMLEVTITHFMYAQIFGTLLALAAGIAVVAPYLKGWQFRYDSGLVRELWKRTYPFALLALIMMAYNKADLLMIRKMVPEGNAENGIYSQSIRLLEAVTMIAALVSGLLLPMFASMIGKEQDTVPLVRLSMLVTLVPAIMGVMYCYSYGQEIMDLLYHYKGSYNAEVFMICISTVIPYCVMYIFGTLLTAAGKMRVLIITALVALAANLLLNALLIPVLGAKGAAYTALVTQSIVAVLNLVYAVKELRLRLPVLHLVKFPVLAVLCLVVLRLIGVWNIPRGFSECIYIILSGLFVAALRITDMDTLKRSLSRFSK